jgi:membrane-associated PAP2 superfamily phosphatase
MGFVQYGMRYAGKAPSAALWPWTFGALLVLLAWDASGFDLPLARLMADGRGFALRDNWVVAVLLHDWMRRAAFLAGAWLLVGIWWPVGVLRRLSRGARINWLVSLLLGVALINVLKYSSHTSCPWDLSEFGGAGTYLSHWSAWARGDGGPGRCFPAGHASAGFAFIGGFFALRQVSRRLAVVCLVLVVTAGMMIGLSQQLRGAHFMSHTLWTAWFCWVVAWTLDAVTRLASPAPHGEVAWR